MWTVVFLTAWLLVSVVTAETEAQCEAQDAFLCFTLEDTLIIAGIYLGALWLFGLFVAGVVAGLRRWRRYLSENL